MTNKCSWTGRERILFDVIEKDSFPARPRAFICLLERVRVAVLGALTEVKKEETLLSTEVDVQKFN